VSDVTINKKNYFCHGILRDNYKKATKCFVAALILTPFPPPLQEKGEKAGGACFI
jgi:hypothetical protein